MPDNTLSPAIEAEFGRRKIDRTLTLEILDRFNRGEFDGLEPIRVKSIPQIDGEQIVDLSGDASYSVAAELARHRLLDFLPSEDTSGIGTVKDGYIHYSGNELRELGLRLLPLLAYGVLNGGSASSYVDEKKNRAFSEELYEITRESFSSAADLSQGRPKGTSPAFIHPDGTPGPSFLELKLRSLLIHSMHYRRRFGEYRGINGELGMLPVFQMTSEYTDSDVAAALEEYRRSTLLEDLKPEDHPAILSPLTARQPLIAAYTHSSEGVPKRLFTRAWAKEDRLLPLPGGHGQNFAVLADIYRRLYAGGKRFAYLGNIDNLGNTINLQALAITALSGAQGAFEFSYKTAVDVKGGILVRSQKDRLSSADIGPAISREEVARAEVSGTPILFNCATGIFDLRYFSRNIDTIAHTLPIRFSDQNKDAGMYSQAEQITWEVIGMLDKPLIFAVNKYERFLASKLLLENLMTSGIELRNPDYPPELRPLSANLHQGLKDLLTGDYGLRLRGARWEPLAAEEIRMEG